MLNQLGDGLVHLHQAPKYKREHGPVEVKPSFRLHIGNGKAIDAAGRNFALLDAVSHHVRHAAADVAQVTEATSDILVTHLVPRE